MIMKFTSYTNWCRIAARQSFTPQQLSKWMRRNNISQQKLSEMLNGAVGKSIIKDQLTKIVFSEYFYDILERYLPLDTLTDIHETKTLPERSRSDNDVGLELDTKLAFDLASLAELSVPGFGAIVLSGIVKIEQDKTNMRF